MFEDLIPSASAQTPTPPPGMFDDLIPSSGAAAAAAAKVAAPGGADEQTLPRSTAGTDPGDESIEPPARNGQSAVALSGQANSFDGTSASPGLFDDLIPAAAISGATANGLFASASPQAPSGFAAAITDIPREMGASTQEAWGNLRRALPSSLGGERDLVSEGTLERLVRTGQGLLAAAALPFAPLQGIARSVLGHPMVAVDQALRRGAVALYGEDKVRAAELATGQTPGGMSYDDARRNADTALSLIAPRRGSPAGLESRQLRGSEEIGETRRPPDQGEAGTTGPPPDQHQLPQNGAPSGAVSIYGDDRVVRIASNRVAGRPKKRGSPPIGDDGYHVERHHQDQVQDGLIIEMTREDHRLGENYAINHPNVGQRPGLINRILDHRRRYQHWAKAWDEGRFRDLPELTQARLQELQRATWARIQAQQQRFNN